MKRYIMLTALALAAAVAATPASAVVHCKKVGVPKGCVARPVAPGAAVAAPKPGNRNGGVNRAGVRR